MTPGRGRPVRLGVLGCGVIAHWVHLPILASLPGAALIAAADPDADARARAGRRTGAALHERPEDLLARGDVDAVVVCAPTHLHAELAVAVCDAGKHLYLEKPIATTAADARRVVDAAKRAGVTAVMGFNRRYHPVFEQARALIAAGRIGPVRAVQTAFCEPMSPETMPEWKRRRSTGGGVLLDLASHHVDLLRWFLDEEVASVEARVDSERSEEDAAWLRLTLRGGAVAQCVFSFGAGLADSLEFIGERGTLRVDRHRPRLSLRVPRRLGYGTRTGWTGPRADVVAWRLARLVHPSREPSYRRSLAAFVARLRGRPVLTPGLEQGARVLDVVLAAEAAAREGRAVSLVAPG